VAAVLVAVLFGYFTLASNRRSKDAQQRATIVAGLDVAGMTDLDKKRLIEVAAEPASLWPGDAREFVLVSRLTLSGPANLVVRYRLQTGGSVLSSVSLIFSDLAQRTAVPRTDASRGRRLGR